MDMRLEDRDVIVKEAAVCGVHSLKELGSLPLADLILEASSQGTSQGDTKAVDEQIEWSIPVLERAENHVVDSFELNNGGEARSAE